MKITLKTLPNATEQQVFDQVVKHLKTQNAKCFNPEWNACLYRYGEMSCAAGCLMSDEEINTVRLANKMTTTWQVLVESHIVPTYRHQLLIGALQRVHDWQK